MTDVYTTWGYIYTFCTFEANHLCNLYFVIKILRKYVIWIKLQQNKARSDGCIQKNLLVYSYY